VTARDAMQEHPRPDRGSLAFFPPE
jgi:hypothetical protein